MAVFKRGKTWWFEFTLGGRRVRESTKTGRKTVALKAEEIRRAEIERAHAGIPSEKPTDRIRTVAAALSHYQESIIVNHRERTVSRAKSCCDHVNKLLGSRLLPDLNEDRIIAYMTRRKREGAANRTCNMEVGILARAVGQTWKVLWPKLRKLEERQYVGRALSPEEEQRVLDAAARNQSRLIYPFVRIALLSGMRHDEIRLLQVRQIDFEKKTLTVGRAKTARGEGRLIEMGPMLEAVISQHAAFLASRFGPLQPNWYLFPHSSTKKVTDPSRPVTSLKTAWYSVLEEAKVDCRFHDLRHTTCTKMAEGGVPESTMLDIMGHMSAGMLRRYSHIRQAARKEAMAAIEIRSAHGFSIGVPTISPTVEALKGKKPS